MLNNGRMTSKQCGIYLLEHIGTGKRYVGQSIDIVRRLQDHEKLGSGRGVLSNAIKRHGWSAFKAEVLELCEAARLDAAETEWISKLATLHPTGYNLTTGGVRYRFTDSARSHIAEKTREALASPAIRKKISDGLKRRTPETLAYIKEQARLAMSPEVRAKISAGTKGKPKSEACKAKMRGIPKTAEWRAMMSERQRNPENIARLTAMARNQSAEAREKNAASKRGRTVSAETREKIAASKRGIKTGPRGPFSAETRAKMSASAKARCARQKQAKQQAGAST